MAVEEEIEWWVVERFKWTYSGARFGSWITCETKMLILTGTCSTAEEAKKRSDIIASHPMPSSWHSRKLDTIASFTRDLRLHAGIAATRTRSFIQSRTR